ncbi:hypothetical protein KCP73_13070 [Salmonella enterica subsp. enterica]|nr:hypothetical protein KCP73_13070 [Salmonella enterica subsp. enterica]
MVRTQFTIEPGERIAQWCLFRSFRPNLIWCRHLTPPNVAARAASVILAVSKFTHPHNVIILPQALSLRL